MITQEMLNEAIAECNGQRHPNADTCMKLASYFTIKNEMFPKEEPMIQTGYSYAAPPVTGGNTIDYDSGTEFSEAVYGKFLSLYCL